MPERNTIGRGKKCPPITDSFNTEAEALSWVKKTHCKGDCVDAGYMIISVDGGSWDAIRLCRKR